MLNVERIWRHRAVILAALSAYEVRVKKVNKEEEALELESDDSADRLEIIEELRAEFRADTPSSGTGIEGTPMGDALAAQVFKADDGTSLDVDALDEMLRRLDIDAPLGPLGEMSLDTRKEVYAWVKAVAQAKIDGVDVPLPPQVLRDEWFLGRDEAKEIEEAQLEHPLSDDEIEQWITKGPWGVHGDGPSDEWAIKRPTEKDNEVIVHPEKYGQLDRARLIAANLNRIEATPYTAQLVDGGPEDQITSAEYDAAVRGEIEGHAPTVAAE